MSGPAKRANVTVDYDDRGRIVHTLRQSTLGELDICLERGRLTMTGEMPNVETDAANLGTGVHAAIEEALRDLENGEHPSRSVAHEIAWTEFEHLTQHADFVWVKYSEASARKFIEAAIDLFFDHVLDRLDPLHVELPFGPLVIHEDDERVIQITGTIDLVDAALGAADWKTSGRADAYKGGFGGKGWEKTRWAIQPTVYLWALVQLGILEGDGPWPFTYFAFAKTGGQVPFELQELTVERHVGDFAWLADKCLSMVHLVEADLHVWPKADNHALCSETWCPAWSVCKGKHYETGWPKPSVPVGFYKTAPEDVDALFEGL